MNLDLLRHEHKKHQVAQLINDKGDFFLLPDQDVLMTIYGSQLLSIDAFRYNLSERLVNIRKMEIWSEKVDMEWIVNEAGIIHYCGKNKPWNRDYKGVLDVFYYQSVKKLKNNAFFQKKLC